MQIEDSDPLNLSLRGRRRGGAALPSDEPGRRTGDVLSITLQEDLAAKFSERQGTVIGTGRGQESAAP